MQTDGIDLNCGCPQRWAMSDGYGACLLEKPEIVQDMIHQVRNRISDSRYTVSLKIRVHDDLRKTVEYCKRAEQAGVSFISVHGRTKSQRNEPINVDAIKLVKENVSIPVVGNGDVFHLDDIVTLQEATGVNGVMCARGLLQNPTLFTGTDRTPSNCVTDWIDTAVSFGATFTSLHHHLIFMLEKIMPKAERKLFNTYSSFACVLDHLECYNLSS
nr:tRNA-dihydrouridine(20a/20b) synthase [NAD(P)+]-like isoform X1 [Parasteatoda tepidariorum]